MSSCFQQRQRRHLSAELASSLGSAGGPHRVAAGIRGTELARLWKQGRSESDYDVTESAESQRSGLHPDTYLCHGHPQFWLLR